MRRRLASLLAMLWAAVQAYFLLQLGGIASHHVTGWSLCLFALLLAILLVTNKKWARPLAMGAALFMLCMYGWICIRQGAPHLTAWIQPILAGALLMCLVKQPSNKSFKADGSAAA